MTFSNRSFETAGDHAGCADQWTFACTGHVEYAEFDGQAAEAFDNWPNALYEYDLHAITTATFGGAASPVETFEKEWASNDAYVTDVSGVAALFDTVTPQAVENFEEDWSNDAYKTSYTGVGTDLTAASFDASPEAFEDFEEGWASNDSYVYTYVGVGTDLTAASFDTSPEAYEDFEEDWPTLVMTSI